MPLPATRVAIVAVVLLGSVFRCWAAEDDASSKPVCNASHAGEFWPPSANDGQKSMYEASRSGDLEICERGIYRYKWRPLTVSYRKLVKNAKSDSDKRSTQQ